MESENVSYEWDLSPLTEGKSFEEKRKDIWEKVENFESKWRNRNDYLDNAEVLKEALDKYEDLVANYLGGGDEGYYYFLKSFQDKSNSSVKSGHRKADDFSKNCQNKIRFFTLNLSKIPEERQKNLLSKDVLSSYRHFLEDLFERSKYTLSEEGEKIMDAKSPVSYDNWADMTLEFVYGSEKEVLDDEKNKIKKPFTEIEELIKSKDEEIRNSSIVAKEQILKDNEKVAETEINSLLENKKVDDEIRGYSRPDQERHLDDDIDSKVVDSLIETISENFDISRRFYGLKANLLGYEKLDYEERKIDYGRISSSFNYEEAKKIVSGVFEKLDSRFETIFENLLEGNQIDVFPKKGKEGGACCLSHLKNQPTYILLNYNGKVENVKTLAHEVGHAIHKELMKGNRNALNMGSPKSTAEVASTFMEDFVFENLLKNVSEEEEFALKLNLLEESIGTIFRQASCYKFEKELHNSYRKEGYLSNERIGEIFANNMKEYLGDVFKDNENLRRGWIYWPHIRFYFYTYSYVSGILISKSLQKMVRKNSQEIEKIKNFMKAGTSKSPKHIFSDLGIDITDKNFWREGILEVRELLEEVESKAKKLGKI